MADNTDGTGFLRSPRQASQIFALSGARAPRQKNLFVVNFRKAGDTTTTGLSDGTWNKDIGFLVKSVDRPSIEPKVEEMNQYNKKRQVNTGYKIGTTRMTIYDTADSMAMRMWAEYAKFYFGDFRHTTQYTTDWQYDVTLPTFQDTANTGYGFAPQAASTAENEYNSQFFLDRVSVYQVFGGKFVQFDLVHPKITSFAPDSLDYSSSDISTYTLTLACEAVIYVNDFQPSAISGDAFLKEAFSSTSWFNGDTYEVPTSETTTTYTYPQTASNYIDATSTAINQSYTYDYAADEATALRSYVNTSSTGILNSYGSYDFGSTVSYSALPTTSVTTDLSVAALTNGALASALSLSSAVSRPVSTGVVVQQIEAPKFISQAEYDAARAAVEVTGAGLLTPGQQTDGNIRAIIDAAVYGAISSSIAAGISGRDEIYNRHVPTTDDINSWNSASGTGLALSSATTGIMNAQRAPTSQIGFNTRNLTPAPQIPASPDTYSNVKPATNFNAP